MVVRKLTKVCLHEQLYLFISNEGSMMIVEYSLNLKKKKTIPSVILLIFKIRQEQTFPCNALGLISCLMNII